MEMDELLAAMAADADAEAAPLPNDAALARVSELARKQADLEQQVADAEAKVKDLKAKLARVTELELPEALDAVGLAEVKLLDGSKVSVDTEYFANISAERQGPAYEWLRDQGHGDLIKNELKTTFGRGEDDQAAELMAEMDARGISYSNAQTVHPQTLKAFVKEQLEAESDLTPEDIEAGKALPRALFGVHKKRVAKVKAVAKRKKANG